MTQSVDSWQAPPARAASVGSGTATVSNAVAQLSYLNSAMGIATNEIVFVGTNTFVVSRSLDGRHRLVALALSAAPSQVHYAWDAENRLVGVSNGTFAVSYAFSADDQETGHTVMLTNGIVLTRVITRDGYLIDPRLGQQVGLPPGASEVDDEAAVHFRVLRDLRGAVGPAALSRR